MDESDRVSHPASGKEDIRVHGPELIEQGGAQLQSLGRQIEEQVRRQPVASLLIAAGVGFVFGILWKRR